MNTENVMYVARNKKYLLSSERSNMYEDWFFQPDTNILEHLLQNMYASQDE